MRNAGAFIFVHGRPDQIKTLETLKACGYTGQWWLVADDLDPTLREYQGRYPGRVLVFSKAEVRKGFDMLDNFDGPDSVVVFARNVCWKLAREQRLTHFVQLDDDYNNISYTAKPDGSYGDERVYQLDRVFETYFDLLDCDSRIACVGFAQGGDLTGGSNSAMFKCLVRRKAMNAIFCRTDRSVVYNGRLSEDINAYLIGGQTGRLFLTFGRVRLRQQPPAEREGGITETYNRLGFYAQAFYSFMVAPSFIRIIYAPQLGRVHQESRHAYAYPRILHERHRK